MPNTVTLGIAVALSVAAFVSDLLDGYLARSRNLVSSFGICFDPIADKIFNLCAFAMLIIFPGLSLPMFPYLLILIRELGISGVRTLLLTSDHILVPAERFGKVKSALQFAVVFWLTTGLWLESLLGPGQSPLSATLLPPVPGRVFWAVALYTFVSSWTHIWKHRKLLLAAWQTRGKT